MSRTMRKYSSVGVMTPLNKGAIARGEVAFKLSFDHPGKARRRTPENWRDFEACTIRLSDDRWTSEFPDAGTHRARQQVSPAARKFHEALLDALAISPTPGHTTRDVWFDECVRRGLAEEIAPDDDHKERSNKKAILRKYIRMLVAAEWIGVDGETVRDLTCGTTR